MTHQPAEDLTTPRTGSAPPPDPETPSALPDTETEQRPKAKLLDLSLTQLLGGSLAAATAAALGSRLGVVGTITGAAVLSVISAIAANVYTNSMARARDAVVVVRSRRLADGRVVQVATERVATPRDHAGGPSWWQRLDRATTRRLLVMAAAVFAIAAAVITVLQLTTGAQVTGTDLGTRTSVSRVPAPDPSPAGSPGGSAPAQTGPTSPSNTPSTSGAPTGSTDTSTPSTTLGSPPPTTATPSASNPQPTPSGTPAPAGASGTATAPPEAGPTAP